MVKPKETLIFLPAYNEEGHIGSVLSQVKNVVSGDTEDILVVDDGSSDSTAEIAESFGCLVVRRTENSGNGIATSAGLSFAKRRGYYKYLIKLDADGQHDPRYIPRVLELLKSGVAEFVICSRYHPLSKRQGPPPDGRRLINIMITETVNTLTNSKLTDVSSGFCGYTVSLLRKLKLKTERYGAPVELVIRARSLGYEILELPHPAIYLKRQNPLRLDQYIPLFVDLKNELKWML